MVLLAVELMRNFRSPQGKYLSVFSSQKQGFIFTRFNHVILGWYGAWKMKRLVLEFGAWFQDYIGTVINCKWPQWIMLCDEPLWLKKFSLLTF